MSPLPAPTVDGINELMEFVHQVHTAWEASGGETEALMGGLVAAGAVTGIDEGAVATLGTATVLVYLADLTACAVGCAGSSIWDAITASNDSYVQSTFETAANSAGIAKDTGMA
jgi:hypothetical protein